MAYSALMFAWGDFNINDRRDIVTNFNSKSGYRCPICPKEFNTKRKEVFRKHMSSKQNYLSNIPSYKERCQQCNIPLDPAKSKRYLHLQNCAGNIALNEEQDTDPKEEYSHSEMNAENENGQDNNNASDCAIHDEEETIKAIQVTFSN